MFPRGWRVVLWMGIVAGLSFLFAKPRDPNAAENKGVSCLSDLRRSIGPREALAQRMLLANGENDSASPEPAPNLLEQGFREAPRSARPWVYWWWLNGNVDEATIQRDLEAMARIGVGGFLLFDARGYHDDPAHVVLPPPKMEFMSPAWRRMVRLALEKADQLGLEVSINLSICAGSLKGPWPVGDDAPKKLLWQSLAIQGPQKCRYQFPKSEGPRFWPVALLAVQTAETPGLAAKPDGTMKISPWQEAIAAPKPSEAKPKPSEGKPKPSEGDQSVAQSAIQVVDLTARLDGEGRLNWQVPPGRWVLLRFGYRLMEDRDKDVDILDPAAVEGHFQRMGKALLDDAGALAGKTLTHFYTVSWEGALPTWTRTFDQQFQNRRGYAIRPWLPVLAGFVVRSPEQSARFLRDYHTTLAECFQDNYYGKLQELCHRHGLRWHAESGGPWNRTLPMFAQADQLAFLARTDMPQGEFWWGGGQPARHRAFNRCAAMTAHIYGKPLAAAEAFTHMVQHWSAYPATLKPRADRAFCEGINHLVWHTFTASPAEFGLPGIEYFAGTHLNPNVTWFPLAGPFLQYLGRCQWMLRQGEFVADGAVYVGDRPYLDWNSPTLRWDQRITWSERSALRLPQGYTYDLINTEVLLQRAAVPNGHLVLPDGMRYRLLVVDLEDEAAEPAVLRKLVELAKAGVSVVLGQRRPNRAPGLTDYPACDEQVRQLAQELWSLGISGKSLEEILRYKTILPDFEGPADWNYIHRHSPEADIYFVATETLPAGSASASGKKESPKGKPGVKDQPSGNAPAGKNPADSPGAAAQCRLAGYRTAECIFRVQGKQPELWDAVTGKMAPAEHWRPTADGRTALALCLPENGSVFVVFRKPCQPTGTPQIAQKPKEILKTVPLRGPWEVCFQPGRGAPASATFPQLIPWNEHPDKAIRYFSGTAVYRKTFEVSAAEVAGSVWIDLGRVHCIAQVRLNGKDLGVLWTPPWRLEATGAVRPGQNELEIAVTNTWVNRLIGDAALPPEKRLTKTNIALRPGPRAPNFRPYQGVASEDPLEPAGLLGPVQVEFWEVSGGH